LTLLASASPADLEAVSVSLSAPGSSAASAGAAESEASANSNGSIISRLTSVLAEQITTGVGIPARGAALKFVTTLTHQVPEVIRPHVASLLRACQVRPDPSPPKSWVVYPHDCSKMLLHVLTPLHHSVELSVQGRLKDQSATIRRDACRTAAALCPLAKAPAIAKFVGVILTLADSVDDATDRQTAAKAVIALYESRASDQQLTSYLHGLIPRAFLVRS
jgi:hypothetical protein